MPWPEKPGGLARKYQSTFLMQGGEILVFQATWSNAAWPRELLLGTLTWARPQQRDAGERRPRLRRIADRPGAL
jgi:hypothetical protein